MIRPVGVDNAQLGHAGVAALGVAEIVAAEFQVVERHGKAHRGKVFCHFVVVPLYKALYALNVFGNGSFHIEGLGLVKGSQTALGGVDKVVLYLLLIIVYLLLIVVGDIAFKADHARGEHLAALALGKELHALLGGVAALVVLTGQVLHSEHAPAAFDRKRLLVYNVGVRLRKHYALCLVVFLAAQSLDIIADYVSQVGDVHHTQVVADIPKDMLCFNIEAVALFNKNSDYI